MANKSAKSAKSKAINDVAHPDKTPPSPNSKSVIITNRPILKDPMVVDEASKEKVDPAPKKTVTREKLIDPVTEPLSHDGPAKAPSIAQLAEAAAEKDKTNKAAAKPETKDEKPTEDEKPEPEAAEKTEADEEDDDSGSTDRPDEAKVNDKELEARAAAEAKREDAIEKLVDSKQYFLPINSVEKRRSQRFVALGILLSILLILAWADIALDAGLIQISGIKPVTHFFSN